MCKEGTLEKIILVIVSIVWFVVLVAVPVFIFIYPNFSQPSDATLDMFRSLDNACITISSVILATILAIMTILISKDSPFSSYKLLDISSLPFFAIVTGLFSLFMTYFDFNSARLLVALSMEFTIGSIFALYLIISLKRTIFQTAFEPKEMPKS